MRGKSTQLPQETLRAIAQERLRDRLTELRELQGGTYERTSEASELMPSLVQCCVVGLDGKTARTSTTPNEVEAALDGLEHSLRNGVRPTQTNEGEAMQTKTAAKSKVTKATKKPLESTSLHKPAAKIGLPTKDTIGGVICTAIKAKKAPDEILKEVKKKFPKAKTTQNSIAYYRSKLREAGQLPKE